MEKGGKYPKNYLKELRKQRGWTLRDLEQKTGWSNQTLSNLELLKADLTWSKLQKLADIFECHPIEIMEGTGEPAPKDPREKKLLKRFRGFEEGEKEMFSHMLDSFKSDKIKADPATKTPEKRKKS